MKRFSRAMILLVMFGSVWMQGVLPAAASDHDMMSDMGESSCLNHCLSTLHTDSADDLVVPSSVSVTVPQTISITSSTSSTFSISSTSSSTSHHDPGLVLKTIKRE